MSRRRQAKRKLEPGYAITTLPLLIGVGVCCVGLLLFTDYSLYDSIWVVPLLHDDGLRWTLWQGMLDVGRPLDWVYTIHLSLFPDPVFASKVIGFLCWITIGLLLERFLRKGLGFDAGYSAMVAVVGLSIPVFDLLGEVCLIMHILAFTLFWIGWNCLLFKPKRLASRLFLRIALLCMFFLSFNLNSLLCLFYSVLLTFIIFESREPDGTVQGKRLAANALKVADFFVLPLIFWTWKALFCPLSQIHTEWGYNKLSFDLSSLLSGSFSLFGLAYAELMDVLYSPFKLLASGVLFAGLLLAFRKLSFPSPESKRPLALGMLCGGLWIAGALFPYVATGKLPTAFDWGSRNSILLGYPISLFLVSAVLMAESLLRKLKHPIPKYILFLIVSLGIVSWNSGFLRFQALGAKQAVVSRKIQKAQRQSPAEALNIRDYCQLPKTISFYPHIVWTFLLAEHGVRPQALAIDSRPVYQDEQVSSAGGETKLKILTPQFSPQDFSFLIRQTSQAYCLPAVPREGKTSTVVLMAAPGMPSPEVLGVKNLIARILGDEAGATSFDALFPVTVIDSTGTSRSF